MAEENKEQQEEQNPKKKAIPKPLVMIIAGLVVMFILTFLVGYFVMREPAERPVSKFELGPIYTLEPFIVNLIDYNGRRYLKAEIDLELESEKMQAEIEKKIPFIRNIIINILSSKTFKDISSIEGKDSLRREVVYRINRALTSGKIQNVYFKEFVIQ